jgi:hypothetical protein
MIPPSSSSSSSIVSSFLIPSQTIASNARADNRKSKVIGKKTRQPQQQPQQQTRTCTHRDHDSRLYLIPSQSIHHNVVTRRRRTCTPLYSETPSSSSEPSFTSFSRNTVSSTSSALKNEVIIEYDQEAGDSIIQYQDQATNSNKNCTILAPAVAADDIDNYENETRYKMKNKSHRSRNLTSSTSTSTSTTKGQQYVKFKYTGNLPDIYWRAIPMNHLRAHPNYKPLPHSESISQIDTLEDARYFRQDSWQWTMLHNGRCTTSQAAPALGLLEPNAAKLLKIPRSLQKGCMGAFRRLGQSALRTLEEMNSILCCHDENTDDNNDDESNNDNNNDEIMEEKMRHFLWKKMPKRRYPFAARYMPLLTQHDLEERRIDTKYFMSTILSPMRIRMTWGNSQEATAILTALNYFHSIDPGVVVKEVGMCGAGLKYNSTSSLNGPTNSKEISNLGSLLLGASPDAVIEYSNGTLEVLEVKNHCPFVPARKGKSVVKPAKNKGDYRIREMPMNSSVPPAYIPQLMMEMMCLGDDCKSAVMCRQTATNGAIILRLKRDDEWIREMIYWLEKFVADYVREDTPPPQNFFWVDEDEAVSTRYQAFVNRTKEISDSVELVNYVPHGSIQRVLGERGVRLPLFLD